MSVAELGISYEEARERFPDRVDEALGELRASRSMWRHAPPRALRWRLSHATVFSGSTKRDEARLVVRPPGSNMRYASGIIVPTPPECRRHGSSKT